MSVRVLLKKFRSQSDLHDGLPMVRLPGDKGEKVAHLLQAVYQRGYYNCEDDSTPPDKITALLTFSSKYDVATVRADVIKQLARNYPTTLEKYEELETANGGQPTLFGGPRSECHLPLLEATAITSQSEADIQVILPALYYACSCSPIDDLFAIETLSLPPPILHKLFLGERHFSHSFFVQLCAAIDGASPPEGCPFNSIREHCNTTRRSPQTFKMTYLYAYSVLSRIKGEKVIDIFFEKRCDECRKRMVAALENTRAHLWGFIPACFGLESWDAVRGTT